MNYELLRVLIAVLGTGVLAWEDWKTSFMDDRVLYAMIVAGALLNLATLDASFVFAAFAPFTVIMLGGYLLWRAGQFGAGDVYLFAALQLLLPFYPAALNSPLVSPYLFLPFVFSVFIASSLFATVGSGAGYAFMLRQRLTGFRSGLLTALSVVGLALFYLLPFKLALVFYALFWSASFMFLYRREVVDLNVERVPLKKIEDEDVLALDRLPGGLVKKFGLKKVVTREQRSRLKKTGLKKFPVYKHLPRFGPYAFAGLAACLLTGDFFLYLVA